MFSYIGQEWTRKGLGLFSNHLVFAHTLFSPSVL